MVKPGAPGLLETSWWLRLPGQALNSLSRPTRILPIWAEHARSSISPKQKRHRPACRRSSAAARSGIQSFRLAASCPGQIASSCTSSVLHLMLHSGWISLIEHRSFQQGGGWMLSGRFPQVTKARVCKDCGPLHLKLTPTAGNIVCSLHQRVRVSSKLPQLSS